MKESKKERKEGKKKERKTERKEERKKGRKREKERKRKTEKERKKKKGEKDGRREEKTQTFPFVSYCGDYSICREVSYCKLQVRTWGSTLLRSELFP